MTLFALIVLACGSLTLTDDSSETPCREREISMSDWIEAAVEAECRYISRCLEADYPGYGESSECIDESRVRHTAYTADGSVCVDTCLAEEFLLAYLEGECASADIVKPLPYNYAYKNCVLSQGL